jgi:hypothetical protein
MRSWDRDVVLVGRTIKLDVLRGWEFGIGREWEGRSVYKQPGAKVDGIAPHKRRDSK